MSDPGLIDTPFGFKWGPIEIKRLFSDPKFGYLLEVKVGKRVYEVSCNPTSSGADVRLVTPEDKK